jgi:hypothetical protein
LLLGSPKRIKESYPVLQLANSKTCGKVNMVDLEVFLVWIGFDLPWIVFGPKEPGMLSGPNERPIPKECRKSYAGGNSLRRRSQIGCACAVTRPVVTG